MKTKDKKNASMFARFMQSLRTTQPTADMSDSDVRQELREALLEKEPGTAWIEAVYPDRVVYAVYMNGMNACFERAYTLDEATGVATVADTRVEVEAVMSWEPVEPADEPAAAAGKKDAPMPKGGRAGKIQAMHDHAVALGAACTAAPKAASTCGCKPVSEEKNMEKKARVTALIGGKTKMFVETDRAMLEGATEEQLTRFEAAEQAFVEPAKAPAKTEPAAVAAATVPAVTAAAEPAKKDEPKAATFDEVMKTASPEVQALIASGLAVGKTVKAASIKALKDSGRCDLTDAQLEAKSQDELNALVKLAGVKSPTATGAAIDYSGRGLARTEGSENAVPAAPDFNAAVRAASAAKKAA